MAAPPYCTTGIDPFGILPLRFLFPGAGTDEVNWKRGQLNRGPDHGRAHPQRTRPQRSRQHQLQRRFPQRSRQQFRHLTSSRLLLGPLSALFDGGTIDMADPVVEAVASSSPANPIASAIFDMGNLLGERRLVLTFKIKA